MNTVDENIAALVARYRAPDACLGALLCDNHPADDIAFTVVDADLSHTDLTYADRVTSDGRWYLTGDTAMTVLIHSLTPLAHPAYRALPLGRIESMHGAQFLVEEE